MTITLTYNPDNKLQIIKKIISTMENNPYGELTFDIPKNAKTIFEPLSNEDLTEENLEAIALAKKLPRSEFINY